MNQVDRRGFIGTLIALHENNFADADKYVVMENGDVYYHNKFIGTTALSATIYPDDVSVSVKYRPVQSISWITINITMS